MDAGIHDEQRRAMFLAIFQQNCENVRHVRYERLTFTNIYAIVAAAALSLLRSVKGEPASELALMGFLLVFSVLGLLTSLRLKAELQASLENIERAVEAMDLEKYMSPTISKGDLARYPQFRWIFPIFFGLATIVFFIMFLYCLYAFK